MLRFRSSVFKDDPIIMQTIKQEKTNPNGQAFADCEESRMGVHKKTKIHRETNEVNTVLYTASTLMRDDQMRDVYGST